MFWYKIISKKNTDFIVFGLTNIQYTTLKASTIMDTITPSI